MRPRDWLILAVLLGAALWFGWDRLQQTPLARTLRGECATPRGCPAPPRDPLVDPDRGLRKT
ncbi:hypothetical protein [Falsiroseomonas sp.]|uniref:hypothetical protein n=1 Tax=Falsiroseomonas sp. TaxID=2870721 RepID=UPI003F6E4670